MKKKILLSVVSVIVFALVLEITGRLLFFHFRSETSSGLVYLVSGVRNVVINSLTNRRMEDVRIARDERSGYDRVLFSSRGEVLLSLFKSEYEGNFKRLAEECRKIQSELIVIYFQTSRGDSIPCDDAARDFYNSLAIKYGVRFVDLTSVLSTYPLGKVYLYPENGHLSRFGNQLLAERLNEEIKKSKGSRSSCEYDGNPVICGDLIPSSAEIWNFVPSMPYRVIVNKQGFRAERDLDVPQKRQRVLCLGDSYTFGPYLPNHDTYPDLLNKMNPDLEVINAGICGYTITDEASLFVERAKHIAPDITILQVVANDITGLYWFMKNEFNRKRFRYEPTPIEKELMDEIVRSNKMVRVLH